MPWLRDYSNNSPKNAKNSEKIAKITQKTLSIHIIKKIEKNNNKFDKRTRLVLS